MKSKYIEQIAASKAKFHKERAKMSYEEKVKVIIELQKIGLEMSNVINKGEKNQSIDEFG